jgi:hypothetical protein
LSQECNFIFSHFDRQNNTSEIIQLHSWETTTQC